MARVKVGVTSDTFDRERGKINVQQSLMERVEAVRATGIADEISLTNVLLWFMIFISATL